MRNKEVGNKEIASWREESKIREQIVARLSQHTDDEIKIYSNTYTASTGRNYISIVVDADEISEETLQLVAGEVQDLLHWYR